MSECIFCKIAAGQIKADVVYQDAGLIAFRDVNPQAPVHILIIPRHHVARLSEAGEQDWPVIGGILRAARDIARQEGVDESGFRLVTNNGRDAGQTVGHLHFHLMAKRKLAWPPG